METGRLASVKTRRKRRRLGYNGTIHLDIVLYTFLRQWSGRRGVSMRAAMDSAINEKLDELEQKDGKS